MRLTVRAKMTVFLGLIVLIGAVAGTVLVFQLRAIDELVREVTEVDEPISVAAFEMEINLIGTGFAVLGYLHDRDPLHWSASRRTRPTSKNLSNSMRSWRTSEAVASLPPVSRAAMPSSGSWPTS
ncbi:MAG: hypothetical protein J4N32_02465 [Chloroflexi bacterium]|nr:hypothetical protein [Chloroflexota bacterium]